MTAVLAICVGAGVAGAQTPPIVVTGPTVLIGDLQLNGAGGGWFSGQAPLGGTFVVGANGNVIVGDGYGGTAGKSGVFQIPPGGTQTILANFTNSNAAGMDQYGNVYVGRDYGDTFIKLPFVAGQYVGFNGSTPTANCLGGTQDTVACVFAIGTKAVIDAGATAGGGNAGFTSIVFDGQGNFFFATDTNPGASPGNANTIYECSAKCQAETDGAGTFPPVVVYADTQAVLGAVTIDPWGNLFFTDGQGNSSGNKTYVEELPFSGGKYAAKPTVVTTYTSAASYNALSGVVATNLGTIYFAVPNDGVYAIPNSSSGPDAAGIYKVSNEGGKGMTLDATGNVYVVNYSNTLSHDGVFATPMGNIGFGASAVGTATSGVAVSLIDMAGNCTTAPTLSFSATSEYAVTPPAGGSCGTSANTSQGTFSPAPASNGASFSATITFTPAQAGARYADLIVTDSANSASGMAALNGVGQAAAPNVDPGVTTTFSTGLTKPASIVADAAGDVFIADAGAGKVYEIANGTTTLTSIGSGFTTPDALTLDPNGDLFIADDGTWTVEEIPNTAQPGSFTAGTQATTVAATALFGGEALGSTTGLAIGPQGTLYVSDPANNRVVYFNLITGQAGVTLANATNGLKAPMGLATDPSGNLYVADSGLDAVVELSSGAISTIASASVTEAVGVAVDGSGSVLIADGATGNIVRIPMISGALVTASAVTIEALGSPASSLWADAAGDLYAASGSGGSAYAIQRTAASINLGTVSDGADNTGTVYLMNAGNEAATLGNPNLTQPANTMFTLAPAATSGCAAGTQGPAGALCAFTAEFAPPAGSGDAGPYSGTGAILVSTPSLTIPVTISGTASVSAIAPQTITYNPVPPATGYIGQQITLSATATSGLAVTITSSSPNVCTVTGSTAAFTGAGDCIIDANQGGGTNNGKIWGIAPQVITSITITSPTPAGVPALLLSQQNWIGALPNGGAFAGDDPAGTSLAVNSAGQVVFNTSYGSSLAIYDPKTGAISKLGPSWGNQTGGVAVDSSGNLYVSALYKSIVAKIPFVNGAYVTITDPTGTAPPNCGGNDTTECTIAALSVYALNGGVASMTFDSNGDLFVATDDQGGTPFAIYECNAACQNTGVAPALLFQEPTGASPATTGQLYIGGIAVDPWGNVFFTDSNFINQTSSFSNKSTYSDLYELPTSAGAGFGGVTTGYAASPTLLQTFTVKSPGGYDDEIDGVGVTANGTVYYAYQYDGVYGIPNTKAGGPDMAQQFAVSGQGAKVIGLDANGNVYFESYSNSFGGDALGQILVDDVVAPTGQVSGAQVTAPATVVDNAFGCNVTAALDFVSSNPEFSATAGTTCSGIGVGSGNGSVTAPIPGASSYAATLAFSATQGGPQTGTLTITDTANGGEGTSSISGTGAETPQAITITSPTTTTYTYAPALTITLAATGGASNTPVTFTVDSSSTGAGTIASNTLTVTQAGNIVIDANEVGGLVNGIYYEAAPQVQLTLTINKASQAIVFSPQSAPATYAPGLTITLTAAPGASSSPVVFSVDPGSATTGAGTISGNVLTVTQAGNIVIDANQAADVNYNAAAQVQQTFVVNQASQTVTFIPLSQPLHYIQGGLQVQISATGGATDNPIVFTVDTSSSVAGTFGKSTVSGATSTATLTIMNQASLATFPANVLIDANQPGNTNYAAATQAAETISLLQPLPTQSITFNNPGTQVGGAPMVLAATTSSGFPVTYTASPSNVCTVAAASGVWTATFVNSGTTAATCTITAYQPGDNQYFAAATPVVQTFAVNPTGQVPSLNISLSLSNLTMQAGTVGLTQVTVNSVNNFTGSVAFTCSGAPTGYTCTFNPSTITSFVANATTGLPGSTTASSELSISGGSASGALPHGSNPLLPEAVLAVAVCFVGFRRRRRIQRMLMVLIAVVALGIVAGCGGSSSTKQVQPTTTTLTVTATSGTTVETAKLNLTVD